MRIAVLVYGRLNNSEYYDNIVNSIGNENTIDFFLSSDNSSKEFLDKFINTYNPISYINDEIHYTCGDLGRYPGKRDETNIHNMTCHFINKQRVYNLLENYIGITHIKYDIVMSTRTELFFYEKIIFNKELEENTIYIPNGHNWLENAINDITAYGNISVMKKYMNIYDNIIYILDLGMSIPHPESLTFANIKLNNLNVCRFNLNHQVIKYEYTKHTFVEDFINFDYFYVNQNGLFKKYNCFEYNNHDFPWYPINAKGGRNYNQEFSIDNQTILKKYLLQSIKEKKKLNIVEIGVNKNLYNESSTSIFLDYKRDTDIYIGIDITH